MRTFVGSIVMGTLAFVLSSGLALADSQLHTSDARVRLMPGDLPNAGYFVLHNGTGATLTLVGAHSDAYDSVEMHKSMEMNGMAKMKPVPAIEVAAGGELTFAPSGYHLMLMQRVAPLKVGDTVVITLELDSGESLPVTFDVVSPSAM